MQCLFFFIDNQSRVGSKQKVYAHNAFFLFVAAPQFAVSNLRFLCCFFGSIILTKTNVMFSWLISFLGGSVHFFPTNPLDDDDAADAESALVIMSELMLR